MIQSVEIRNFQSLRHVSLEPGKLTVIVGPSSVGKSAFTRALRTLTSNRRGADFISHGERIASISATTERGTVTLTRGKGTADNAYVVIPADHPEQQRTYTKLGGETPEEVSRFLGIDSRDPINYAGQFDKPYMLDDSGGEVARVLGALTNVNVIFEGARESNRRKLSHAATLRTRADDLEAIRARVPQFRAIKAQDEALSRAEALIAEATQTQRSIARLTEAVEQQRIADDLIARLEPIASRPVPSDEGITEAAARLTAYRDALRERQEATKHQAATQEAYEAAEAAQRALEADYDELIGSIGDNLAGWFAAVAEKYEHEGTTYVTLTEAVRVAALYIEEQAKA